MRSVYPAFAIALLLITSIASGQNATEPQAVQAIAQAENDMKEMSDAGFGVVFINDTLLEAKKALNATNHSLVIGKTQVISERKYQAYNISDSLRALQLGIEELDELGLNASSIEGLLNKSMVSFREERYEEAEETIKGANTELTKIRAEATLVKVRVRAARENIISFVKDNWIYIIIGISVAAVIGYIIFSKTVMIRTANKLKGLEIEKEILTSLIKKAQADHFQKRMLSKESYEIKIKKYNERMLEIKELLPVLKARLKDD